MSYFLSNINKIDNYAIEIENSRIGISEEYLPGLIKAFSHKEQGNVRKFDGNGLRMAFVKKVGRIWALLLRLN